MNPAARLGISLVASLVLWFPTLQATIRGDADLLTASVRYLLAFGLARVAVGVLAQLVAGYAAEQEAAPEQPHSDDTPYGRRLEDLTDSLATAED